MPAATPLPPAPPPTPQAQPSVWKALLQAALMGGAHVFGRHLGEWAYVQLAHRPTAVAIVVLLTCAVAALIQLIRSGRNALLCGVLLFAVGVCVGWTVGYSPWFHAEHVAPTGEANTCRTATQCALALVTAALAGRSEWSDAKPTM